MASRYVVNVQILRFLAAVMVAVAHVGVGVEEMARSTGQAFALVYPLDWGLGVDLFFVISGFIMYFMMHNRFEEPGIAGTFLKRRLIRIVPLYWICTTLMLISILVAGDLIRNNGFDPVHIIASYLFFPWPRADGEVFPLFSLGWTLNYEMFFYLAFAGALVLPKRVGLMLLFVGFCALSLAAAFVTKDSWLLKFWGLSMILEFLLGIGLAHLFLKNVRIGLPAVVALIVVALVAAVAFYQTDSYDYLPRILTGGIPALLITGAMILGPHAPQGLTTRLLAIGGDASYALYMTHPFAIKAVTVVAGRIGLMPIATFWLTLVAVVAVSVATHFLVEKPIGAWLHRLFDKPQKSKLVES